jgi:hypothetical protein
MNTLSKTLVILQESGLGIDNFYCANVWEYEATLYARYSLEIYNKCIECNYTFQFHPETNSLKATNGFITILLNLK